MNKIIINKFTKLIFLKNIHAYELNSNDIRMKKLY